MIILRQKEFNTNGKYKGTTTPGATKMSEIGDVVLEGPNDPRFKKVRKRVNAGEDRYTVLDEEIGPGASEDQTLIAESYKKYKDLGEEDK